MLKCTKTRKGTRTADTHKKPKKSEKKQEMKEETGKTRLDWERNNQIIRNGILDLLRKSKGTPPTVAQIADYTQLHKNTILKHIRTIKFKPQESRFRVLTDDVILGLYRACIKGDARASKLWFQILEGFVEKKQVKVKPAGLDLDDGIDPDDAAAIYNAMLSSEAINEE